MTSHKILLFILLPSIFFFGMQRTETPISKLNGIAVVYPQDSTDVLQKWKKAIETDLIKLKDFYTDQSIRISGDSLYTGPDQIASNYKANKIEISDVEQLYTTEAHKGRGISYEIISFMISDSQRISQLVIYEMHGGEKLRSFEFEMFQNKSLKMDIANSIEKQLIERRKEWMKLCNDHKVNELVQDLYSENTMYYNHRPLVTGREDLIKEYGYMNNEKYTLSLHPEMLHTVNDSTVFEIGQCKGSYGGKYILIWKKEEDGQWRIFIDSNI